MMYKTLVIFAVLAFWNSTTVHMVCPTGWHGHENVTSCYIYISSIMNSDKAQKYCFEQHNAVVASPRSEIENNFLKYLFGIKGDVTSVLIGLRDKREEGVWDHYDGDLFNISTFSTDPWATGLKSVDCVIIQEDGLWRVKRCGTNNPFWCQRDFNIPDNCTSNGWFKQQYSDICYKQIETELLVYDEAIQACESIGYDILMPKTNKENTFVTWYINEYLTDYPWIGLTDVVTERHFVWDSGCDSPFRAWGNGQPDNTNGEDCVRIDGQFWNDVQCLSTNVVICQSTDGLSNKTQTETTEMTTFSTDTTIGLTTDLSTIASSSDNTDELSTTTTALSVNTNGLTTAHTANTTFTNKTHHQCMCLCINESALVTANTSDIGEIITAIKVDVKTLSSTRRLKTCATDPRPSSASIGAFGIVMLVTICTWLVFSDFLTFLKFIHSRL